MTYKHPLLGPITFKVLDGSEIEITSPQLPIETVVVPQLKNVPLYDVGGTLFGGKMRWHKRGIPQLLAAWGEVEKQGLLPLVLTFDGSLNSRLIRGSSSTPSNHAFGSAFDINAAWNGLHVIPPPIGRRGSVRALAPIFEKHGFRWGGSYETRPDGMHFEIVRWMAESLPEAEVGEVPTAHILLNNLLVPIPGVLRTETVSGATQTRLYVGIRSWAATLPGTSLTLAEVGAGGKLAVSVSGPGGSKNIAGIVLDGIGYVPVVELYTLYPKLTRSYDGARRELSITLPA